MHTGRRDDRGLDGAVLVQDSDLASRDAVDAKHGITLTQFLLNTFDMADIVRDIHIIMVRHRMMHLTHHC